MKHLISYILLLIIGSCTSNTSKVVDKNLLKNEIEFEKELTKTQWLLCKSLINGNEINYNECSKILFHFNNKGVITKPSNEQINFEWKLLSDSVLNIRILDVIENGVIENGTYRYNLEINSDNRELMLQSVYADITYYLGY